MTSFSHQAMPGAAGNRLSAVTAAGPQRMAATPTGQPDVSVVFPCLNERHSIGECIKEAQSVLLANGIDGEIIVSDNGSTDGSPDIASALGARVVNQPKRGYGNAYIKGFEAARGNYIIMADSDGTYDLSALPRFLHLLRSGYDFVNGSRVRGKIHSGAMPFTHQYIGVPFLTWFLNVVSGAHVSDAHCGMRGFTREALLAMDLRTPGMEFASEMIMKAARAELTVADEPINYRARTGDSKLRTLPDGWRHLRFILLYSPTYLFLVPGGAMFGLGLLLLFVLVGGPITFGHLFFDLHFMVVGSLLALLGLQVVTLGLYARVYALTHGFVRKDRVLQALASDWSLDRGVIAGTLVMLPGLAVLAWILSDWISQGFGLHEGNVLRPAMLGMTLMAAGVQVIFSSFFISLLSTNARQQ